MVCRFMKFNKSKYLRLFLFFGGKNDHAINEQIIMTRCHVSLRISQCILSFQLTPRGGVTKNC